MRNKRQVIQRLKTLESEIQSEGSLQARIAALNPRDREIYDRWKKASQEYWSKFKGDEAYRVLLGDIVPDTPEPALDYYITSKLHPKPDRNEVPYEAYMRMLES